jgi:hypothetical protein
MKIGKQDFMFAADLGSQHRALWLFLAPYLPETINGFNITFHEKILERLMI